MGTLYRDDYEKELLEKLCSRRRINHELRALLKAAKGSLPQGERLRSGKQLSYPDLIRELEKAASKNWIDQVAIAKVLADSEIAGNQHVLFFELPGKTKDERQQFFDGIATPTGQVAGASTVRDFLTIPASSSYEIITKTAEEVIVKIVAQRAYWVTNELPSPNPDRRLQELIRHRERVPLIVKASLGKKLIQLRVPPRETGGTGSAKTHYEYAHNVLTDHYDIAKAEGWFKKMKPIPIGDAFNSLINDTSSLVSMWSDSPENRNIAASIKNKGRPKADRDLRDDDDWDHANGYARKAISGYFSCGAGRSLFARLWDDRIQIAKGTYRQVARLFVTRYCKDGDLENVIANIRSHV